MCELKEQTIVSFPSLLVHSLALALFIYLFGYLFMVFAFSVFPRLCVRLNYNHKFINIHRRLCARNARPAKTFNRAVRDLRRSCFDSSRILVARFSRPSKRNGAHAPKRIAKSSIKILIVGGTCTQCTNFASDFSQRTCVRVECAVERKVYGS